MSDPYVAALSFAIILIGLGGLSSCVSILKLNRRVDSLENAARSSSAPINTPSRQVPT